MLLLLTGLFHFPHSVCLEPLGLEAMRIPNSAFLYSSSYSFFQGYYARLNNRGWNPHLTDLLPTLQIDFGHEQKKIIAVAVQSKSGGFVSTYELYYSTDGLSMEPWIENARKKVFDSFKVIVS